MSVAMIAGAKPAKPGRVCYRYNCMNPTCKHEFQAFPTMFRGDWCVVCPACGARHAVSRPENQYCANPACGNHTANQRNRFCSIDCKRAYQNLALKRGAQLYEAAMRWRRDGRPNHNKGTKTQPGLFGAVTDLLDRFIAEDNQVRRRAGKPAQLKPEDELRRMLAASAEIAGAA